MVYQAFSQIPSVKKSPDAKSEPFSRKEFSKNLSSDLHRIFPPDRKRELVAGGDVKWRPINKPAAMLLAKSPEINKPTRTTIMSKGLNHIGGPSQEVSIDHEKEKPGALERKFQKATDEIPKQLSERVDLLKQLRASLDLATDMFRADMIEFTKEMPASLEKLRSWRMTMEREKETTVKALSELRQFFLGDTHEKEMQRLSEFVRVCERLAVLAKEGTLEKVADVMLRLA